MFGETPSRVSDEPPETVMPPAPEIAPVTSRSPPLRLRPVVSSETSISRVELPPAYENDIGPVSETELPMMS